jgi:hypothetical protein
MPPRIFIIGFGSKEPKLWGIGRGIRLGMIWNSLSIYLIPRIKWK